MFRASLVSALAAAVLAGCVDSPNSFAAKAAAGDPLALTFDELARQAAASGDAGRAEGFTYAAIAARNGVTPSRLDLRNAGTSEAYEAFVNSVAWQLPGVATLRVPAHRTITAWRRTTDGVTRIVMFTTPSDSAQVLNPLSLSAAGPVAAAFAGAGALYQETTSIGALGTAALADVFWIATSGYVKIRESASGAACPLPTSGPALSGVSCQQAKFVVRVDVTMHQLSRRPYEVRPASDGRRFQWPADQTLSGYKLTFSCATVTASTGCG